VRQNVSKRNSKIFENTLIFFGSQWRKYYFYLQNKLPFLLAEVRQKGLIIKYRRGTIDDLILEEVLRNGGYLIEDLELEKTATVLDIGAHIGCFTARVAKMVTDGKVFSFEPQADNFRILKRNVRLNNLSNVYLFKKALAASQGLRKLYLSPQNTGGHSIQQRRSNRFALVDCMTLEQVFISNQINKVNLLKLDCEGAEYEILHGTSKSYLDRIDKIVLEYHDFEGTSNDIRELEKYLGKNGFKPRVTKQYCSISGLALFSK